MKAQKKKVAVLLSGGVDSSVALRLLAEQPHYELTAFYLKIWLEDELSFLGNCPWEEDLKFARQVCEQISVPLEIMSLQSEYWDRVVAYTLKELKACRTPSPDIFCNHFIKFGAFYDKLSEDFDYIATGHYAIVKHDHHKKGLESRLFKGRDPCKDQTYFLAHLTQQQLHRCLFPLGQLQKTQVRQLAMKFNLATQNRPDSQGICFLGKISYRDFVRFHLGENPGEIYSWPDGQMIGEHRGLWFYTIGQRKGLGLSGGPWFVVKKDTQTNRLYVCHEHKAHLAEKDEFEVSDIHWINEDPTQGFSQPLELSIKIRHGATSYPGQLFKNNDHYYVRIGAKERGVAAGQFAVFYHGDQCLGCATIVTE